MAKTFLSNICGTWSKKDIAKVGNSLSINMYQETTNANQDYVTIIQKSIDGMKSLGIKKYSSDITIRGMYVTANKYIYYVNGLNVYVIDDTMISTKIGVVANVDTQCNMCETGTHLVIVDGVNVYAVNYTLPIADQAADFRTITIPLKEDNDHEYIQPTHCAYLYSYLVVNDSGTDTMYVSKYRPFIMLDETGKVDYNIFDVCGHSQRYFRANYQPDKVLAICSNGSRLMAVGETSYQIFQFTGDENMPFSSPDTGGKMIGIRGKNTLAQLGEYTMWFGAGPIGDWGVYLITNNSIDCIRVSAPELEKEFMKVYGESMKLTEETKYKGIPENIYTYGMMWQDKQHIFYALSINDRTFVYDIKEQAWHERCCIDWQNIKRRWPYKFAQNDGKGNVIFANDNNIVKQDPTNWLYEDGSHILRLRRGGVIYNNYSNFYIDALTIEMNNGQCYGNVNVAMKYTTDGTTWSDIEVLPVGSMGEYDYDCTFYQFGIGKCFTIELSTTDNFPFTLMGIKMVTGECKY